nr:mRNA decay activator protein ZFP36L3-like [Procambarus clarkii]
MAINPIIRAAITVSITAFSQPSVIKTDAPSNLRRLTVTNDYTVLPAGAVTTAGAAALAAGAVTTAGAAAALAAGAVTTAGAAAALAAGAVTTAGAAAALAAGAVTTTTAAAALAAGAVTTAGAAALAAGAVTTAGAAAALAAGAVTTAGAAAALAAGAVTAAAALAAGAVTAAAALAAGAVTAALAAGAVTTTAPPPPRMLLKRHIPSALFPHFSTSTGLGDASGSMVTPSTIKTDKNQKQLKECKRHNLYRISINERAGKHPDDWTGVEQREITGGGELPQQRLKAIVEQQMASISRPTTSHIFTDGSVDQERDSAGAESPTTMKLTGA